MLLSSIIAEAETNNGKGGFGNYSSVLVPLCSNVRSEFSRRALPGQNVMGNLVSDTTLLAVSLITAQIPNALNRQAPNPSFKPTGCAADSIVI